ncbi:MAG: hypothetical protein ACRCVS_00430, partial [Fusobacteriaceae bacterium]
MLFLKKNKKKLLIITPLFLLFSFIYSFIFHFAFTISVILSIVLGPKFSIGNIEFKEKNKIVAENVSLKYKKQEMVKIPKVIIEYDLKNKFPDILKKITAFGGKATIIRENESINIIDAFVGTGKNQNSESKSGTEVPVGIIEAQNVDVVFKDLSYKEPIELEVPSTNGYVSFDKIKGIDLLFQGKTTNEEKASYSFNNYEKEYSMTIKGENLNLNTNILQFAYYSEDIEYSRGKGNINLTIDSDGLFGSAEAKELDVKYRDFSELAKDINGKVEFLGNKIKIDANFNMFKKKRKFLMDFDFNNELIIKIPMGKMTYGEVAHYKLLEDLNLNINKYNFENLDIILKLDKAQEFSATIDFKIANILEKNITLKNNLGKLVYTNENIEISLLNSDLELAGFKNKFKFSMNLKDKEADFKYSLGDFKGDGNLLLEKNYLALNLKSGFVIFNSKYMYENEKYILESNFNNEEKFKLVYDFKN